MSTWGGKGRGGWGEKAQRGKRKQEEAGGKRAMFWILTN